MTRVCHIILVSWGCFFLSCHWAVAQNIDDPEKTTHSETDLYLNLALGVEYDTNVSISDIDLVSGLDDVAVVFKAKAGFKHKTEDRVSIRGNYNFLNKKYDEFSQFDQQVHFGSLDFSKRFDSTSLGVTGRYLEAKLDGQSYVEVAQISPYVSRYFGKTSFARAHYTYGDKTYEFRPERDGSSHALGLDVYYFLNGTRQFITAGYEFKSMGAFEQQLAYDNHRFIARYTLKVKLGTRDTTVSINGRYESRKYDDFNFVIGDIRQDDRLSYSLSWTVPLPADTYIEFDVKLSDVDSNLLVVDYQKTVVGITLGKLF